MTLEEIMKFNNFTVVGNTIDEEKYAYKIKEKLLSSGYNVCGVHKELKSIDESPFDLEVIDLCINPVVGLNYLKDMKKRPKAVLIQPGAEGKELQDYLDSINIPYVLGCALVGLSIYKH